MKPLLPVWQKVIDAGIPLFLTGDFNAPSHLDWTEASVGSLPHMKYAVDWPVSQAVGDFGFVDTFRAANPDPVADPGRTWTYGYPYPRLRAGRGHRPHRLRLRLRGDVSVKEAGSWANPVRLTSTSRSTPTRPTTGRWSRPSMVTPAVPPMFVAVEQARVERGQAFGVRYHSPDGEATDRLVVVKAGRSAADGAGIMWLPPMEASYFGQVLFGSGNLPPGAYDVVLLTKRDKEVSRSHFWVVSPERPHVSVAKTVSKGKPITLTWTASPAQHFDWVAIYPSGELDLYNAYLAFAYTAVGRGRQLHLPQGRPGQGDAAARGLHRDAGERRPLHPVMCTPNGSPVTRGSSGAQRSRAASSRSRSRKIVRSTLSDRRPESR